MMYKIKCNKCGEEIYACVGCSKGIVDFNAAIQKHNDEKHPVEIYYDNIQLKAEDFINDGE